MEKTYLFYDIETSGLNKCFDQIVQFAAIRTDLALNEIARYEYFIKLKKDVIPSPHAFITHRISLNQLQHGLNEYDAMLKIHSLFNTPGTISLGYNTLGFDDEFLRFSFYRNLLPAYTHQYANDCQRMDLYPMTVLYHLYKNDLLKWPDTDLKLENISKANDFLEGQAHNAMADVIATLKLAKCMHQDQPTWQYVSGFFDKKTDLQRCNDIDQVAILIDGKFGFNQQYQSAVLPLGTHQHYQNQTLWLRVDHDDLLETDANNFIEKTWVVNKKYGEPGLVLPMKQRFLKNYLQSKESQILDRVKMLRTNNSLLEGISHYYRNYTYPQIANIDPAAKLYQGGFLSFKEQELCKQFHQANPKDKIKLLDCFDNPNLKTLTLRILGHQEIPLSESLQASFETYCTSIITGNESVDYTGKKRYSRLEALQDVELLQKNSLDSQQHVLLGELTDYLNTLMV